MKTIISIIADYYTAIQARYAKENNDVNPTIDAKGRMHSPHDGYVYEGVSYLGGQYLPDDMSESNGGSGTNRFKIPVDSKDAVLIAIPRAEFGKEFNGMCYAYVELHKNLCKQIEEFLMPSVNAVEDMGAHYFNDGEKITIKIIRSESVCSFPTQYGTTFIDRAFCATGEVVYFKGSNNVIYLLTTQSKKIREEKEIDAKLLILEVSGTVSHEEYNGKKQTVIKRPKATKNNPFYKENGYL